MDIKELQKVIVDITIWKKGDQRAPHKPLLLFYVLSQYKQGHKRLFDYKIQIQQLLLERLNNFSSQCKTHYHALLFLPKTSRLIVYMLSLLSGVLGST